VIEDHGSVSSSGVGEPVESRVSGWESGFLLQDTSEVLGQERRKERVQSQVETERRYEEDETDGVSSGFLTLTSSEMTVDEAERGVVDDETSEDGSLVKREDVRTRFERERKENASPRTLFP